MSTTPSLTSTSYAILGLLSVRPFTTYEIAQQMDRALGHFWPRARSKIYEEPKKLVAVGLATATPDCHGRRPRTVYAITPGGRQALAAWLGRPSAPPALEFEHLVKVFFCEAGSKSELLATIEAARRWSINRTVDDAPIPQAYLDGEGPFPERLPWLVLVGQFLEDFAVLVERWADWASAQVEDWPDDLVGAPVDTAALAGQASRARRVIARERRRSARDDAARHDGDEDE